MPDRTLEMLMKRDFGETILRVEGLAMRYPISTGLFARKIGEVRAVDDVSFTVAKGETLALVGESGSGKTTTARCIIRAANPSAGEVWFRNEGEMLRISDLPRRELRPVRRGMQMIFQDPFSSLNPRMTLAQIIGEPMQVHRSCDPKERMDRVAELLRLVGLRPEYANRFPHAFSGGQRQRIGIARALALNPDFIIADEPVSALDVSVQAQILNLMLELQDRMGLSYLMVSHDLSVVRHVSDRIAVMYLGRLVEIADTLALFDAPRHPYTAALLSAIPVPDPRKRGALPPPPGEIANPANPPSGCHFHPRCPFATDVCRESVPRLEEVTAGRLVRCHRAKELGPIEPERSCRST